MSSDEMDFSGEEDLAFGLTPSPASSSLPSSRPQQTPSSPSTSQPSTKQSSSHSYIRSLCSQPSGKPTDQSESMIADYEGKTPAVQDMKIAQVKMEFLNKDGCKVAQSRSSSNPELIAILQSVIRSGSDA